jgi:hypothetical protein
MYLCMYVNMYIYVNMYMYVMCMCVRNSRMIMCIVCAQIKHIHSHNTATNEHVEYVCMHACKFTYIHAFTRTIRGCSLSGRVSPGCPVRDDPGNRQTMNICV